MPTQLPKPPEQERREAGERDPLAGLGSALRTIRECRRLTQAQVAEAMGIPSPSAISEYENGAGMTTTTLGRMLSAMGADTGDLAKALGQAPNEARVMRFLLDLEEKMAPRAGAGETPDGDGDEGPQHRPQR